MSNIEHATSKNRNAATVRASFSLHIDQVEKRMRLTGSTCWRSDIDRARRELVKGDIKAASLELRTAEIRAVVRG